MQVSVQHVKKTYGTQVVLNDVSFTVQPGECLGVIGPNGSGKSTLLKLISAVEHADSGFVALNEQPVTKISRRELAKKMAVLLQDAIPEIEHTVRAVLAMGRYPYQNWWGNETKQTDSIIADIAYKLCLEHLLERPVNTLSGGERQRVAIGKAMAQQPQLLLLDEPTTYLDIGFQMQMLDLVRKWQHESNLTIIAVLHDLNLAAQYCDRILLLSQGQQMIIDKPEAVMEDVLIERVFGTRPIVLPHPVTATPQILLQRGTYEQMV
jgi:iron complex transport system ATP-binding protein